jgi:predicted nucleotidyltransferase
MTIDDVALRVADVLNEKGIAFILVGGFSSNYYGVPRSTQDADFVIELNTPLNPGFERALGSEFEAMAQLSFETNTGTQRQEFRVKDTAFKVEVFRLSDDPHDQERFRRRKEVDVKGHKLVFPTPEDVIIWKLRWARQKDLEDVRAVIGVQQPNLDWPYIESWCHRLGTSNLLERIRARVPKI